MIPRFADQPARCPRRSTATREVRAFVPISATCQFPLRRKLKDCSRHGLTSRGLSQAPHVPLLPGKDQSQPAILRENTAPEHSCAPPFFARLNPMRPLSDEREPSPGQLPLCQKPSSFEAPRIPHDHQSAGSNPSTHSARFEDSRLSFPTQPGPPEVLSSPAARVPPPHSQAHRSPST